MIRFGIVVSFVLCLAQGALAAVDRVALIIGNADYKSVERLNNPLNDAQDLAKTLDTLGFDVTTTFDADLPTMLATLRTFQKKSRDAEVALIYYAGHGIELGKENYLIPTDAELKTDRDVPFEAIELDNVVLAASGASRLSLVILDACRNNPFAAQMERTVGFRSIGRGLAEVEPQGNTIVAYAAKAGTVAADGEGRNSPYAEALMAALGEPQLEVGLMFRKVRDTVLSATRGRQEPFWYGSLSSKELFLNENAPEPVVVEVPEPPKPVVAPVTITSTSPETVALREQAVVWEAAKASGDPAFIEGFLKQYPESPLRWLAELELKRLQERVEAPSGELDLSALKGAATPEEPQAVRQTTPGGGTSSAEVATPAAPAPEAVGEEKLAALVPEAEAAVPEAPKAQEVVVVPLGREGIREVQERLTVAGFAPGPVDGVMGGRTRAAISKFELLKGVEVTGEATSSVLELLRKTVSDADVKAFRTAREERRAAQAAAAKARAQAARRAKAEAAAAAAATAAPIELTPVVPVTPQISAAEQRRLDAEARRQRRLERARQHGQDTGGGGSSGGGGGSSGGSDGGGDRCSSVLC